ncbi:MAG TPA: hypothetical protein VN756_09025 [Solirubrobacterales bacterium]|nr:hypothetical protein [Solirubrobacterales bacterium]
MIYRAIGKAVVRMSLFYVRQRYARQIRVGIGLGAVGLGIAAYLATRNVPEG